MKYTKIVEGIFLKRPNRFIAHVLINDKEEIVHVKNTGRCRELLIPGAKVILEDCSHNLNRKTKYSLIAVWKDNMLVNMDSQVPNYVVFHGMEKGLIKGFENVDNIKREVSFKNSRFDIYFEDSGKKGFMEVKGVTLENHGIAMFPDAPTVRGARHVLEMIEAVEEGYKGCIFFLIQMKGPKIFKLNWKMDKDFSQAVKLASEKGVDILAYDSIVTENNIYINQQIPVQLEPDEDIE
ncbi:MAG: DNA/RNA nuclease SfsA [Clostridiales bacterium]|nr:DNA/RNA nuclease SfsA [Clostridiales bacterium]